MDQDCWPKNARLNSTIAHSTGTCVTKMMPGITPRERPSASLREKFDRTAAREQPAREPAAEQAADAGRGERHPRVVADLLHVESARVVEVLRQPGDVEEPRGVGQELRADESPDLPQCRAGRPRGAATCGRRVRRASARWRARRSSAAGSSAEYARTHHTAHSSPTAPQATNTQRQLPYRMIAAIAGGATTAPTAVPALTMPIAVERSRDGKPLGDDLGRGGEPAALADAEQEPARRRASRTPVARLWLAHASDQKTMITRNPRRVPSRSISTPPPAYISAYASRNIELSAPNSRVGERNVVLDRGDGHRQRLPIEIADRDRHTHEQGDAPAGSTSCAGGLRPRRAPLTRSPRGAPAPHSARAAHSHSSFASNSRARSYQPARRFLRHHMTQAP